MEHDIFLQKRKEVYLAGLTDDWGWERCMAYARAEAERRVQRAMKDWHSASAKAERAKGLGVAF